MSDVRIPVVRGKNKVVCGSLRVPDEHLMGKWVEVSYAENTTNKPVPYSDFKRVLFKILLYKVHKTSNCTKMVLDATGVKMKTLNKLGGFRERN